MKRRFALILIMLSLLMAGAHTYAAEAPFGLRVYEIGHAPNFKLTNTDGEAFELDSTRGQWVFLHFWASWCGPCRKEMPLIQKLSEKINSDKFRIVMVNTSEDEDTVFTFLASLSVDIDTLMDTDGQVTEAWKPRGLPTTFLIDPHGKIRYQAIGGRQWDNAVYVNFINKLIASK